MFVTSLLKFLVIHILTAEAYRGRSSQLSEE